MTKKELREALWGKFEESHEYINGAKTPEDISCENTLKLINLSGDMVNMIAQYVFDVLPISNWNDTYVVVGLRRAAKLIENTLDERNKGAISELEQLMDDLSNTTVVAIPGGH